MSEGFGVKYRLVKKINLNIVFYLIKDKMDAIMCATMGNNLVELRHYYSRNHNLDRQNLVRKKITYNSPHQC